MAMDEHASYFIIARYCPLMKLWEGNVFTHVGSVHGGGGGERACVANGSTLQRGGVRGKEGVHGKGVACMAKGGGGGGVHGKGGGTHAWEKNASGKYAFCWNAFLLY